jgi:putative ABC transport system permease protein
MIREGVRTFRLGVKSLMLHKLRSSLTTLGLLFGVSSVIAMLAVGEGASYETLEKFKGMGTTNIMVRSQKPPDSEQASGMDVYRAIGYGLKYKDAVRIRALFPQAEQVVSVRETPKDLRHGSYWSSRIVLGVPPEYLDVMNMKLVEGSWISTLEMERQENVTVLGASAARTLFPLENPLGQSVQAGADRFTVIGILDYLGRDAGPAGVPVDECIFVPITTSRSRFGDEITKRSAGSQERTRVELSEIKVKFGRTEDVIPASGVLNNLLQIGKRPQDDVSLTVPLQLLKDAEATARIFNIVLASIAVISLLVGGIGIMNVMLATVTERTREIGIRRALGAKKTHIVYQFLVETAVLSGAGGILGVGLGLLIPQAITAFSDNLTIIRAEHVLLAFLVSAGVGVTFGLYPAWRAANMDPVEALRHE